jgi:hypothetical protein
MWRGSAGQRRFPASLSLVAATLFALSAPLSGLRAEEPATRALREDRAGSELRSALGDLNVTGWHDRGQRGQGVKVAILDSGFRGYRALLGKGLPKRVTVRSFRIDHDVEARDSQHGILCAEVVHAIAPEAELLFANWEPDSPAAFLDAVRWARAQGARIVTCSVVMPGWSDGEGGGPVHALLQNALGAQADPTGMLCFASAGNLAQRHWSGTVQADGQGFHIWPAGHRLNRLTPWGSERVAVELYGPTNLACSVQVYDALTGSLLHQATVHPESSGAVTWGTAAVRFEPDPNRRYAIALRLPAGVPSAAGIHLVVLGAGLERSTARGSIPFPGDGTRVITLGAVNEEHRRQAYSSCGPNSPRPKPDFVARVPFPSTSRMQPFSGTSAAAPQAAGVAALLLGREPHQSPVEVHAALRRAAIDLAEPGHDCETGFGLIRLP